MVHDDIAATVSAADLVRSFPVCRDRATLAPLFVANHGRTTHVLIGIDQYKQLSAAGSAGAEQGQSNSDDLLVVAENSPSAVFVTDVNLQIVFANNVAHAVAGRAPGSLNGRGLTEALPELADTLIVVHLRRTMSSKEPYTADLPSPFNDGAFVQCQTYAISGRIMLIMRDISEEVKRYRLADVKQALLDAMDLHGGIGYIRVSPRGTIERVDAPLCTLLGLPEERLMHIPLLDLATTATRSELRAALDHVLRGDGPRRVLTSLLSNDGKTIDLLAAIVPLHGTYGTEGAVILATAITA